MFAFALLLLASDTEPVEMIEKLEQLWIHA